MTYNNTKNGPERELVTAGLLDELDRVRLPDECVKHFAARADVSATVMWSYLSGDAVPSLMSAHRLCHRLGLNPCALLAYEMPAPTLCDQALGSDARSVRAAVAEVLRAQLADAERLASESAEGSPARAVGELLVELLMPIVESLRAVAA